MTIIHPSIDTAWKRFTAALADPKRTQWLLLQWILRDTEQTVYGRQHAFESINSGLAYQHSLPVTTHADLASYIDRMMRGEANVLFRESPGLIARTSGTTGTPKYITFSKYVSG